MIKQRLSRRMVAEDSHPLKTLGSLSKRIGMSSWVLRDSEPQNTSSAFHNSPTQQMATVRHLATASAPRPTCLALQTDHHPPWAENSSSACQCPVGRWFNFADAYIPIDYNIMSIYVMMGTYLCILHMCRYISSNQVLLNILFICRCMYMFTLISVNYETQSIDCVS